MIADAARAPSLMRGIVVRLSVITAIASAAAYGWFEFQGLPSLAGLHEDSLRRAAVDIASDLVPGEEHDRPVLRPAGPGSARGRIDPGTVFAVRDMGGAVLAGDGQPMGAPPAVFLSGEDGTLYEHAGDGRRSIGMVMVKVVDGAAYLIQVEQDADDTLFLLRAVAEDFVDDGGWVILPILLALLTGSILTIRKTLAPLDRLSRRAAAIAPASTDVRLPEGEVPAEVLPLVRAFNRALDRLEEGYRLQREFTADAAHELRTPLAILRAQVDVMVPAPHAAPLREGVDTMARLVAQLLDAARMDAMPAGPMRVADLRAIAIGIAEFIGPLAIAQGKSVEVVGPEIPLQVTCDADAVFDALRNLAENALAHSPPGGVVTLACAPRDVAVIDRGSGIAPHQRAHLFCRFWRADRSRSGAGLGLTIVKRIAEIHGATVGVEDTPGGGATFRLRFPASPDG